MSALAGVWNFDGKPGAGDACARILAAQAMYGPHDASQWDGGNMAVGRRLFRILPEDAFDGQPLDSGGGRYTMVADLRLDNRDELIDALGIGSERARTLADSAILLAAWERWEEGCFDRLVGGYAFAVWDRDKRRLVLARDPLGHRPLHYHRGKNFFAFASMPKGLHALPEIPRVPDEERVAEFLLLIPESGSRSYFKNVERVESGSYAIVTPNGVEQRRHWSPTRKTIRLAGADDYVEALRHHLDQAVRSCLRGANGAVASHLSSGFDSSAVAATAARLLAPGAGRVVAFTAVPREGFDGPSPRGTIADEGPIAAKTAALYPNMEHVLIRSEGGSPVEDLDRNFHLYDRPVLNLFNNTWIQAINDAARERKLRVILSGQQGNATVSHDGLTLLPRLVRSGRWIAWLRQVAAARRGDHLSWRALLSHSFGPYTPEAAWTWLNQTLLNYSVAPFAASALNPKRMDEFGLRALAESRRLDLTYRPRGDGFEARLWVLNRMDTGNMWKGMLGGWGLDRRVPLADRRLAEFCLAIPEEQFLAHGVPRALARCALADRLPAQVIGAKASGFQAPDWYEGLTKAHRAVAREIERLQDCGPAASALDISRLRQMVDDWPNGGWEQHGVRRSYRLALLRAVSAGHFLRVASGSNA